MPAQDEIFRNIRVVAQGLDALRDEHEAIKNKLTGGIDLLTPDERQLIDEKPSIVDRNLENILLGVEEAQVMVALASHFQNLEADKQKYKAQVRRLCQENAWIRDELNSTQQQLRTAMQNIAQLEEENKHLKFMNSIKKFDEDLPELADKEGDQAEQQHPASDVHNSTLQELGFGDEEEDLQSLFLSYFDFHKNIDWGKGLGWYVDCVLVSPFYLCFLR
uniref:Kinesin light chain n=1 Tax=Meloidogyne javanica TaxID=6303 RepID=A0A915N531_MELJA